MFHLLNDNNLLEKDRNELYIFSGIFKDHCDSEFIKEEFGIDLNDKDDISDRYNIWDDAVYSFWNESTDKILSHRYSVRTIHRRSDDKVLTIIYSVIVCDNNIFIRRTYIDRNVDKIKEFYLSTFSRKDLSIVREWNDFNSETIRFVSSIKKSEELDYMIKKQELSFNDMNMQRLRLEHAGTDSIYVFTKGSSMIINKVGDEIKGFKYSSKSEDQNCLNRDLDDDMTNIIKEIYKTFDNDSLDDDTKAGKINTMILDLIVRLSYKPDLEGKAENGQSRRNSYKDSRRSKE